MNTCCPSIIAFSGFLLLACEPSCAGEQAASGQPVGIEDLPSSHVIVFGELHGTREIPAFFGDQVETLLEAGRRVHVGLEMSAAEQEGITSAMKLPEADRQRALLKLPQWKNTRDGRNSVAMARLLGRLGNLQSVFEDDLSVFSFDVATDWRGDSNDRDRFMADKIGDVRARIPDDSYLLVLTGNAHAFGAPGAPWDSSFRSMTVQLTKRHPVLSLRNLQTGGTAWICTPECSARSVSGAPEREPGIHLDPYHADWTEDPIHDGIFFLGELSASEPLPVAVAAGPQSEDADSD